MIRVFPELGNPWPLWESGSENYTPTPADLGLSSQLEAAIRDWYDYWLAHHQWETGWDSAEAAERSAASGELFVEQLRSEVSAFADVEYKKG